MRFITLVTKNLTRRPFRSSLTVLAVAIAIGTFVALVGISAGFERSFHKLYEDLGIDLIVVKAGLGQRLSSTLDEKLGQRILAIPGVKEVQPGLVDVVMLEEASMYGVLVQGLMPDAISPELTHFTAGRSLRDDDGKTVILGSILATNLGKQVHDTVEIFENEIFEIVGIFESTNVFDNGCMMILLPQLQRLMGCEGQITGVSVVVESGSDGKPIERVRNEIESLTDGLSAMPVREHVETMTELRIAHAMAWITSAVALFVGTAGMLNTMLMSVYERTLEIGILRAIGWRKRRVVRMVLSESLVLSFVGAALGACGAIVLTWFLTQLPVTSGVIDGYVQPNVIVQGFFISLLVGLIGGLVSAHIAANLVPATALRHE